MKRNIVKRRNLNLTIEQLLELRHNILIKAIKRTQTFNDNKKNYYWYFLNDINSQIEKQGIKL